MICLNPKFGSGHNLSFFGLGPWYLVETGNFFRLPNMNFNDTIRKVSFLAFMKYLLKYMFNGTIL